MTIDDIRLWHRAEPFRPFTIHATDGQSFYIERPSLIALAPAAGSIAIGMPDGSFVLIPIASVTNIEHATPAMNAQNGK
jgi:hypothetical protein